jgi:glycosyltransferase involved in cell wall biosynthesis
VGLPIVSPGANVLLLVTEDWFVVSHFLPLLRALAGSGYAVSVATNVHGHRDVIESTGARVFDFDFARGNRSARREASLAIRLRRLIATTKPDVVHAIALKPIVLAALLFPTLRLRMLVLHLTGLGYTGSARSSRYAVIRSAVLRLISVVLRSRRTHLIVENRHDLGLLNKLGHIPESRVTILGGAGVNPDIFQSAPLPEQPPVQIGYVGRMIWSKGVDILVAAHEKLLRQGYEIELHLCGETDTDNPKAEATDTLQAWSHRSKVHWHGRIGNVSSFWPQMSIAVVPSRGGEGLPRSLLEAAACGRPLIVSDVPGCRDFVRHEVEGLVVRPQDIEDLATAIARLVNDRALAERLGTAARQRVLSGYTERHIETAIAGLYARLAPKACTE